METGRDPAPIQKELADLRAMIAAEEELAELQKIANERQALRDNAEAVKSKVQKQGEAIDAFLEARDAMLPRLQELQEPLEELAQLANPSWESNPGQCYLFNDAGYFSASVIDIPKELLPKDFSCPTLEMTLPGERSFGKAREALQYFQYCIGILSNFKKGSMNIHARPTDDSLLLDIGDNETSEIELNCRVCNHEKVKEINEALKVGRPLRELETQYSVSRSTLSRHKNNCLNAGAIRVRIEPETPAASANQTYFRG